MMRVLFPAAVLALALAGPCLADAPVATSNGDDSPIAGAKGPATPEEVAPATDPGPADSNDLKPRLHGEVGVTVGSDGYRSGYLAVSGPIGDNGYAGLAISQSKGGRRGAWGYPGAPIGYAGGGGFDTQDCVVVDREDGASDPTATPANDHASVPRACRRGPAGF